ncbi:hypothetical protein [Listeria portnoyi]|nr:hypothetical protein [Listeria portnoyi]
MVFSGGDVVFTVIAFGILLAFLVGIALIVVMLFKKKKKLD